MDRQHRVRAETHQRGERAVTTVTVDFDPDPADTWFEQTYVFLIRQAGQPLQVETDTHRCGLDGLDEVLELLREVGFEPQAEPWELAAESPGDEYQLVTAVKRPAE